MLNGSDFFLSDEQLFQKIQSGDRYAFDQLYLKYWERLYFSALNVIRDEVICEDLVHDIFYDLWQQRNKRKIIHIKAYLFKAIKFRVFKHIRDHKIAEPYLDQLNHFSSLASPEEQLHYQETQDILEDSIQKLPEKCQQVFLLSRYQQLSNREISEKLGISIKTVENQITKALRQLKQVVSLLSILFIF